MNSPSLIRFHSQVKAGGLILYDSSLVKKLSPTRPQDAEAIGVPASQLAYDLGETKVANVVLLGALMARIPFLGQESIHLAIDESLQTGGLRQLNREALELGRNYCVIESAGISPT